MICTRVRLIAVGTLALILLWLSSSSLLRLYYLLRLPFVWKASSADAIISQQHDDFDVTFADYDANYSTYATGIRPYIPRRIHHIHLGASSPPKNWLDARAECLKHHEFWEAHLWTDENADSFVRDNYPHLYDMWTSYPFNVQRVDALRYMILQKYGGAVLDFDLACKRSLEPLRRFEFVAPAAHPAGFSIGMMLAASNHPYVHALVENLPVYNQVWPLLPYATVMFSTGCHYASTIFTLQSNRTNLRILAGPPEQPKLHMLNGVVNTPLFRHFGSSSWHGHDARLIQFFKDLDQRILFAGLVFALGSTALIILLCISRRRAPKADDEERRLPSFAIKWMTKIA
ncbi:hypothetical protein BDV30DRAFT_192895 [Aspergillus minisclerotigenes]|uniref:Nucleotide-diphospho-sugar transferase n=1 Tax=Aspergillus minisclerotigenes TaxID=656917 RepID=A0A5N6JEW9_9EURO|nr:hypothetical protein BDV30DRAFT_192895 [Aspergillus minisclerotigenes]